MAIISIDRAEEGMVVLSGVTDRAGRLLIPAGKELEEKHLRALKMWGIDSIEIEGEDDLPEEDLAIEPWASEEAVRLLDALFEHADRQHPFIEGLHAYCMVRLARRVQAAGAGVPHVA